MCRLVFPALVAGTALLSAGPAAVAQQSITGQVVLKKPPAPRPVPADKITDKAFCEKNGSVVYETFLVGKTGGLRYVTVFLRPDSPKMQVKFPAGSVPATPAVVRVIDQPCCQFEPRVIAARAGDTLKVKNSAPVNHNFYAGTIGMNPNIPPGQAVTAPAPLSTEDSLTGMTSAPFKCSIHPWMEGYIRVFEHPWFAVTDEDGKFEIKNVPPGKYRIVYLHETGYHKGTPNRAGEPIEVKAEKLVLEPLDFVVAPQSP